MDRAGRGGCAHSKPLLLLLILLVLVMVLLLLVDVVVEIKVEKRESGEHKSRTGEKQRI